MAATDSGQEFCVVAGEGSVRRGPTPCEADQRTANQQARRIVERKQRRNGGRPGETGS